MPGGQPATSNRYCNASCEIVEVPVGEPLLTIDKQQRLTDLPFPNPFLGIGFGTPSDIGYDSPSEFDFKIIIANEGDATAYEVKLHDQLPA